MSSVEPERLLFNPSNATTGVVERIRMEDGSTRIRKVLRRAGTVEDAAAHWRSTDEPGDWNHWSREAEVYRDGRLRASLRTAGLDLPDAVIDEGPAGVTLWLEDVAGTPGPEFALEDHAAFAAALGRWQADSRKLQPHWASHRFLRTYSTTRPADERLVDVDAAWEQPLIEETWPAGLRSGWRLLLAHREQLLTVMEQLPRALCHLDAWVSNVIRRPDGRIVLIDWAFAGDGAIGEDLGNYLPDAVFDLFWPASRLAELEATCWPGYLRGLRECGWSGSDDEARLGVVASCVKYAWLLPALLQSAADDEHRAYQRTAPAEHLYSERGVALAHLVGWCEEALALIE